LREAVEFQQDAKQTGGSRLFGNKALGAYALAGNALFPASISRSKLWPEFPELPAQKPPTTSLVDRIRRRMKLWRESHRHGAGEAA
jgi:hypothetical protein